jgi:competence protein ComEC
VVTVLSYAQSKILIPGDNESPSWKELLAQPSFAASIKNTDILLAPHHGRDAGYSAELFQHINPWLVIISDGRFCDTSATSRYSSQARGWTVHKRSNGQTEKRYCVTTRSDDYVTVELGRSQGSGKPYMKVTID